MIENVDIEELVQVFATRYRGAKLSGAEMRKEIGEMLYQSAQVTFLKNSVQSDISDWTSLFKMATEDLSNKTLQYLNFFW